MIGRIHKLMENRDREERRLRLHNIGYVSACMDELKMQLANFGTLLRPQTQLDRADRESGDKQTEEEPPTKLHGLPKSRPHKSVTNQVNIAHTSCFLMILPTRFRQASGVLFNNSFLERIWKDGKATGVLLVNLLIVDQRFVT